MTYPVALLKTDEGYSVSCPALPGCCSQGATEEEALENIRCAIEEYLAALQDIAFSDPEIQRVEITL
jgi:predicted RNase H-like HicB family nuclease